MVINHVQKTFFMRGDDKVNYIYNLEGIEIPVIFNSTSKRIDLNAKWDLFELEVYDGFSNEQINEFIQSKTGWINKHIQTYQEELDWIKQKLNTENHKLQHYTKEELRTLIKKYIKKHENKRGKVNRVTIRHQIKGKWASCSHNANLTFNDIMCYLPQEYIEYIVYHEMCHLSVMNHGPDFVKLMMEQYHNNSEMERELNIYHYLIYLKLHNEKLKKCQIPNNTNNERVEVIV